MSHVTPLAIDVDVHDIMQLRIELQLTNTRREWTGAGIGWMNRLEMTNWPGIVNARILTTDY